MGKYAILPDFRNNALELAKIDNTISTVVNDKNITLEGIILKGFASPEGSYKSNTVLAGNRVKALAEYIRKKHDFKPELFTLDNGSEDWEGLKAKVEADRSVPSREAVLAIINSNDEPDKKDARLAALDGGAPYRYVLKNIYPSLRRSDYRVAYQVRFFTVEEGREIIKTRPQNLSLNEMFLVANTYPVGSQEFIDVFETAVRMYPKDEIANINAATAALSRNDLISAERCLNMVDSMKKLPEYSNAMGVLMLLKGEYEHAEEYLNVAYESGLKVAGYNLEELTRKKANASEFRIKNRDK